MAEQSFRPVEPRKKNFSLKEIQTLNFISALHFFSIQSVNNIKFIQIFESMLTVLQIFAELRTFM